MLCEWGVCREAKSRKIVDREECEFCVCVVCELCECKLKQVMYKQNTRSPALAGAFTGTYASSVPVDGSLIRNFLARSSSGEA